VEAVATPDGLYTWAAWDHITRRSKHSFSERVGLAMLRYDAIANRWIRVAQPHSPRGVNAPQWTGSRVLTPATGPVCPMSCPPPFDLRGSQYDPAAQTWSAISHGPIDDANPQSLWTGHALLSFNTGSFVGGPHKALYPGAAAVWDPASNRWTRLPDAPYVGSDEGVASVWAGSQLLMWGEMRPAHGHKNDSKRGAVGIAFGL
jgi:hypothetical protein